MHDDGNEDRQSAAGTTSIFSGNPILTDYNNWRCRIDLYVALPENDKPEWLKKIQNAPKPEQTNLKTIAALSGGKDSTAMCLALSYFEPQEITYVITPTGNELPDMIQHWLKIGKMLAKPLIPISRESLQGLIKRQAMIPNHRARFCTRILKLDAYYSWLAKQIPCISYVGLRADEESRPGMIFPDDYGITMQFPMRRWNWTIDDVLDFLFDIEVTIPNRTDCALCFWQKIGEWYLLWKNHLDLYLEGEALESYVSEHRGYEYTFRSPSRDTWPASLRELRLEFEDGHIPTTSLKMMNRLRDSGECRACTL